MASDAHIEAALCAAVRQAHKDGELDQLSIKIGRTVAEQSLKLEAGFFKSHGSWKDRSKDVITQEVEKVTNGPSHSPAASLASSPARVSKSKVEAPAKKKRKIGKADKVQAMNGDDHEAFTSAAATKRGISPDYDSDMSKLADEPAKKTKTNKPGKLTKSQPKNNALEKRQVATPDMSPDEADIRRLQSELLKCGVRKFWAKELAPCETSKAKIAHLKSMLKDVGMTGRFSADKARAIKERRELEADVSALTGGVPESSDDEEEANDDDKEATPPVVEQRRKVVSRFVDFGDSDDDDDDEQ